MEAVLCPSSADTDAGLAQISDHKLITMFRPIGEAVKASYDEDQMQVFLNAALRFFVQMTEVFSVVVLTEKKRQKQAGVDFPTTGMPWASGSRARS
ncbi:hypothetical protein F5X96DRAFT_685058 [Biscogniauxia mediterranea]|nr:hypothetical protein F5X96DRAFT_685058 [Biscogniauxia mediterranea]